LLNYSAVLWHAEVLASIPVEIYVAVLAVLVTAWALWLRWRKTAAPVQPETLAP
jgi:hypothetical protein